MWRVGETEDYLSYLRWGEFGRGPFKCCGQIESSVRSHRCLASWMVGWLVDWWSCQVGLIYLLAIRMVCIHHNPSSGAKWRGSRSRSNWVGHRRRSRIQGVVMGWEIWGMICNEKFTDLTKLFQCKWKIELKKNEIWYTNSADAWWYWPTVWDWNLFGF